VGGVADNAIPTSCTAKISASLSSDKASKGLKAIFILSFL
jgi:hypothetical protein